MCAGPTAHLEAMLLNNLGDVVVAQDDPLAAQGHYEASLAIWRERRDDWGIGIAILNLGHLALRSGDAQRVGGLYGEGLTMSVELGDPAADRGLPQCHQDAWPPPAAVVIRSPPAQCRNGALPLP